MIYPENFEQKIGFDVVREQCRAYCTMQRAVQMLDEQRFTASRREVVLRQSLADEMRQMIAMEPNVPTDEFSDIDDIIGKVRVEGTFIETVDVVRLGKTLSSVASTVYFVRSRKAGAYPCMTELSAGVDALPHVVREIARIVDDYGNIRDSASPELASVRREIRMREGQVSKRLQAVLQSAKSAGVVDADAVISIRDGRAVIPVAAANKRKLSGFIHDESATGKTFYIEPVEVVELNNELRELEYAERRETVRILTAFTDFVRNDVDDMARAEEYIATVDMIRAKARWAVANGGVKPVIAEKGVLRLLSARHPLLAQTLRRNGRELIPLDAELDGKHRILVISGPNAGGKSVCLKTFGLLQYMFQCGFPVTASENSEMPIFRNIYIDIGDQQSIENDLSTYSSHLLNMKAMLAGADEATLVLIDEFGSGTEPIIGAAIAESILERLVASGTFGVITTHYSNIKYFASNTEGVFNGAMMFDVQNIRPLFRLETGKPGSSFAVEIARKIGLPEEIIASAREKAGSEHMDIEKQLREIARDKRYWEQKRERIRVADRKVEELERDYNERLLRIREERNAIIREAKEQAKSLMADANRQIESTIKEIRESQAEREQTRLIRQSFNKFKEKVDADNEAMRERDEQLEREMARVARRKQRRDERKAQTGGAETAATTETTIQERLPLEVNAKVRLIGQDGVGVVQSIRGKRVQVAFGQILTTVDASRLETISASEYRRATRPVAPRTVISSDISQRRLDFRSSIDIRGERVASALDRVQSLVDDALMLGIGSVTILHGKGTGALKEEVRRLLRSIPEVESATDAHPDSGGAGITIVNFKI